MSRPALYVQGPVIHGPHAYMVACFLRRHWHEEVDDMLPAMRVILEEARTAIDYEAARWAKERRGTAEPAAAELPLESNEMDKPMTTSQAADVLGCSERYVRKLIAGGALPARKDRQGWHVDAGAVLAYHEHQGGAF